MGRREGYNFDRLRKVYADEPRHRYGDDVGELYVSTATHGRLLDAGIRTVSDLRARLDAGTLVDVAGIGPTRAASIAEAVAFYDERQLPDDDPQLKQLGALYGLVAGMEQLIAAADLLDDQEFTDTLVDFHANWLRHARALLDVEEGASAATRHEAGYYLSDAVRRAKGRPALAPSTPSGPGAAA